jgi:hypothetical protein
MPNAPLTYASLPQTSMVVSLMADTPAQDIEHHRFKGSSVLLEGEYDTDTQTLTITFASGRSYSLTGVPPDEWEKFRNAPSPGRYFNDFLKGQY